MKTRIVVLLGIMLLAMLLAACDSSPAAQPGTATTGANAPPAATAGAQRSVTPGIGSGSVATPSSTPPASSDAPTAVPVPLIVLPTPVAAASSSPGAAPTAQAASAPPGPTQVAAPLPAEPAPATLADLQGRIIFFSDRDGGYAQLYVMNADGSNQHLCNCSDLLEAMVTDEISSPDGNQFLFVKTIGGGRSSDIQIWRHNNSNNTDEPVTGGAPGFPGVDYDPAWSPDSRHIAWVSEVNGADEIYLYDSIENSNVRLTQSSGEWYKHPSFSPDGSRLVYWTNVQSALLKQIWVMKLDGSGKINLSNNAFNDYDPIWVK